MLLYSSFLGLYLKERLNDIEAMDIDFKAQFFNIMDAVIRDYKTWQMHK
jgi:hypothetical protein